MTDDRIPSDDELLQYLKDSLDNSVEVTDDAIDMLMAGYDIVHADTIEAELTFDSLAAVGVRSGDGGLRQLRFEHGSVRIDVDLNDTALTCTGRVEPVGGALQLEQIGGVRDVEVSTGGAFDEVVEGVGPFRLTYEVEGVTVSTDWMQFGSAEA